MRISHITLPLALAVGAGCSSGAVTTASAPTTQKFTREVNATPARVVQSAVQVFSRYGIPVASADEPNGSVQSLPVDLRGSALRAGAPGDRVNCSAASSDTVIGPVMAIFQVNARTQNNRSIISLEAQRDDKDRACTVKTTFVTGLLDDIAKAAGGS